MQHEPVAEIVRFLRREDGAQRLFDAHGVLVVIDETQTVREPDAVRVHHDRAGLTEHVAENEIGAFAPYAGERQEIVHIVRHLAAVDLRDALRLPDEIARLAVVILEMMKRSEKILREHPVNKKRVAEGKNPATSIWVWGEGTKPQLDNFEEKFGLKGSVISAVDLIKGIAKCAGMNSIDVEGATGNCDTNWEGKAQAALDAILNGSDFVYVHMEAPDEMGHQGAPEKKKFAVETIDKKVVKFLKDELEKRGIDYRMMILPDHPTPIKLKTHVSDPVPYIIYDSTNETDKNANLTYTEENGKKTGIYIEEGYTLMNRFLGK